MEPLNLKHILVIEDDNVLAGMLKQSLELAGFRVSHAPNGEEGKTMALESTPPPDLLIVDIDMPKMDGITMLKMLRAKGLKAPAFVLTNFSQTEHVADAAEAGILEYLVKADWDLDEIVQKVKSRLVPARSA